MTDERFRHLPEPVDLARTITSHDVAPAEPPTIGEREDEWVLKHAGC